MKPIEVRKILYQFYEENQEKGKVYTVNYFLNKGVAISTIYRIILSYDKGVGAARRVRKYVSPKMPPKWVKRLKAYFNHKAFFNLRMGCLKGRRPENLESANHMSTNFLNYLSMVVWYNAERRLRYLTDQLPKYWRQKKNYEFWLKNLQ